MNRKTVTLLFIVLIFVFVFFAMDMLSFPLRKDEPHFWLTSQWLFQDGFPSLEQLRNYNDLNTPVPFLIYGALDSVTGNGLLAARLLNLLLSLSIVCTIAFSTPSVIARSLLSALGILLFPYFLFTGTHVYTDIIASAFVFYGFLLYLKDRHIASAILFVLAISSRQYMVAFPTAITAWEIWNLRKDQLWEKRIRWIAPLISCFSLLGWYIFFGDFGPRRAIEVQSIQVSMVFMDHSLYFLTCIGLYFVLIENGLFRQWPTIHRTKLNLAFAAVVSILFIVTPPLQNSYTLVATMGYLDRTVRLFASDFWRMVIFWILAILACCRFRVLSLPGFLLLANAALMMKAHVAWDKYALPLLTVLWYLTAIGALEEKADAGIQSHEKVLTSTK